MKLYTHQVIGWDDKERTDILKPIIINSEDVINIGDFGYGKVTVFLKNGDFITCTTIFFEDLHNYKLNFDNPEEIKCENHNFYNDFIKI